MAGVKGGMSDGDSTKSTVPDISVKKCEMCSESVRTGVKCMYCDALLHRKCLDKLKTAISVQGNWSCKQCAAKVNHISFDSLLKEIASLRKENVNLLLLLDEKEKINDLLNEKIKQLESNQTVAFNHNTFQSKSQMGAHSYSHIASKTIIVKPINAKKHTDIKAVVKTAIDPAAMNLEISKTTLLSKGGLAIKCDDKSCEAIKLNLQENLGEDFEIKLAHKLSPKIIMFGVDNDDIKNKLDDEIISEVINRNNINNNSVIKLVRKINSKRMGTNLVLSVDSDTRRNIISRGFLYLGWSKCNVADSFHVMRCFNCSLFGHTQKNCTNKAPTCPLCSGCHTLKECRVSENQHKCINCIHLNEKNKNNELDVNHAALSKNCAAYKNALNFIQSRTEL